MQQQFFPSANRPELVVDLWLPNGASITATDAEAKRFEKVLAHDPDIESYVVYIGGGSPRFYLPLDQQLNNANLAEFVVTTKSNEVRDAWRERLLDIYRQRIHPGARPRESAAERPAGGLPGAVSRQRARLRQDARDRLRRCAT